MNYRLLLSWFDRIWAGQLFHIFILYFALIDSGIPFLLKIILCGSGVLALFFIKEIPERYFYWIYFISLTICLTLTYFEAPNHFFLFFYLSLFMAIREEGWIKNFDYPCWLLILVFGLATVQKIISPQFMEGDFMGYLFMQRISLYFINAQLLPELEGLSKNFMDTFSSVYTSDSEILSLPFQISDRLVGYALAHSYLVIVVELILVLILIFFNHKIRYVAVLAFVWVTLAFRFEYSFFAILCLCVLMDGKIEKFPVLRACFIFSMAVFVSLGTFAFGVISE